MLKNYKLKISNHRGFTLIEIMMVLAISSFLMLILLGNYGVERRRAQFTDALERITTQLEQAKNEANTTVNVNPSQGSTPGQIVFAKIADFSDTANPSRYYVRTYLAPRAESLTDPISEDDANLRTIDIPWGITFSAIGAGSASTHDLVAFTRTPGDGRLNTYVLGSGAVLTQANTYSGAGDTATAVFEFKSPEGLKGQISIDARNGEITRRYDTP